MAAKSSKRSWKDTGRLSWEPPLTELKRCRKCGVEKQRSDFYMERTKRKARTTLCIDCVKARAKAYYYKHLEACTERNKRRYTTVHGRLVQQRRNRERSLRNYGLTLQQYHVKLAAQGGGCAICGRDPEAVKTARGGRFNVDHDHATGCIRDLLCPNCNNGLGAFKDRPELLEAAIAYLWKWRLLQEQRSA